ncbi:MAG TPA: sensor histidine kinase [Archangium sp.]
MPANRAPVRNETWIHALGLGVAYFLVAPLLLSWTPAAFRPKRVHRLVELRVLLALTALGAHLVFGQPSPEGIRTFTEEATRVGSPLRVEAEADLLAWWDRGRVEQALVNLVANALKFGGGNPIEIQVSAEGEWVRLAVRDYGIGIAPEALERIFERFERAVSSREYGGLGLGLFLTRRIAESHGGTIHVESHPGRGTTFELRLPAGVRPVTGEVTHPAPA